MSKWRIKEEGGWFYPEKKGWFFWSGFITVERFVGGEFPHFDGPPVRFKTKQEAQNWIDKEIKDKEDYIAMKKAVKFHKV